MHIRVAAATLSVVLGCQGTERSNALTQEQPAAQPSATVSDARPESSRQADATPVLSLTCHPSSLGANDTLTLRMPVPHGPYLTVTSPDATPFFVVFPSDSARRSLVTADSFAKMAVVRLPVRELRAAPWVYGRDTNEMVFSRTGPYTVVVGHDVETDAGVVEKCVVRLATDSAAQR